MVEKVSGFLVVPKKTNSSEKLHYDIWITQGSPSNPFFFTSALIRDAIEKFPRHSPLRSTHVGVFNYLLQSDKQVTRIGGERFLERIKEWRVNKKVGNTPVYVYEYFPFDSELEKNKYYRQTKDKTYFEGKGIALHAERIALRELLKHHPDALLSPSLWMTEDRMSQLKRRGHLIEDSNQLISAKTMLQTINKHIREYRIKNRPKRSVQRLVATLRAKKPLRKRR